MQLFVALLGTLGILLPWMGCEKKEIKKHINKSKQSKNKRWMSNFAQSFIKSQPVQRYSTRYNQDLFNGSPPPPDHFEFVESLPYDEANFQGLKELKLTKQTEGNSASDSSANLASEIAVYMKPGIGDDPSDMPGGLKSYGTSLNGVGLPISGKLRSTKLTPVASFGEQAVDELNPHKVMMSASAGVMPAVIADNIRTDLSSTKILEDMPGKISEVSASVAESSKSFAGAGESSMIVSSNSDATSQMSTSADSSVISHIDANDQPEKSDKTDKTSGKGKKEEKESSEVKETEAGPEKTNEPGILNDSEQLLFKTKKLKQVSGHSIKFNDTTRNPAHAQQSWDDDSHIEAKPLSAFADKEEKRLSLSASTRDESEGNSTNEDDGDDDTEKTPNKVKEKLVSSLREALLENVKEMLNGENSKQLLEEAQTVTDDKPSNGSNSQEEEEGSAESVNPNKETGDSHFVEAEVKSVGQEVKAKETDNQATNLLESNLMKIDKRKLAHLLATLMKKYKSDELDIDYSESGEKSNEKGKYVSDEKHSDERKESNVKADKDKSFTQQTKLTKTKHHENAMLRAGLTSDFFDPYAQIGLTDPKLSGTPATISKSKEDVSPTGRHSVHINLFGDDAANKEKENSKVDDALKPSKEFEGKVETETQRAEEIVNEKVEKQKARLEAEVAKAHAKEGLENEELLKENQEMMKQAKDEDGHKDIKEKEKEVNIDSLNIKQMENIKIAHMKPNHIEENVVIKANQNTHSEDKDAVKMVETVKSVDANEGNPKHGQMEVTSSTPVKEKTDTMREEQNVKAELAKEKEELKMLREEEKLEKAKEEELKMANAELEEKDKKTRDAFLEKVKQEQIKDGKEHGETENQDQLKAAHEQDEEKERSTSNKEKQLKIEKAEEEEQQRLKQIRENQLKAEKSTEKAGKAEATAENAEKEIEKVEQEADSQVKLTSLIEEKGKLNIKDKQLAPDKGVEEGNEKVILNIKPSSMEETVKENSQNTKEKSAKEEENESTNTKDLLVEKTKENEFKAFVSVLEEKEKKEKSLVKAKEEELDKKEMELKEAEKQVELEESKKNTKQHHGEKEKELTESKDITDKESQDIGDRKPQTTSDSNRFIKLVSPELISAITNNLQNTKGLSILEENAGDTHDDSSAGSSFAAKGVQQVPSHITDAEKEATKFADSTPLEDKLPKEKKQERVSVDGKEKKLSMEEKEPIESKPSIQEKEVTETKQDKTSMQQKEVTETKQDKLSMQEKEVTEAKQDKTSMQEKEVTEAKQDKLSMQEKEVTEAKQNKLSMQEKEVTEAKQDKISVEEKLPTDPKQKLSIEAKGPDRAGEREGKNYEDTKEKSRAEKDKETKEKNEDFVAIDGPNIETLIEHMEERMRQRKKEKEISKEATKYSREGKKKNHYIDDAYAQIGSMDPNVKRRKIVGKLKKHYRHHHLKNKKD